jgi:homoserine O-acetyltransferase
MDLHDVGRGRGGAAQALTRVKAPVLAMGISSDVLYPAYQSQEIAELVRAGGGAAEYIELDSPHGHDAFLLEAEQVGQAIGPFLDEVEKDDG